MLKKITLLLSVMLLLSLSSLKAFSATQSFDWYCIRTKDHTQPTVDKNFEFISNYGGYYVDKDHSDNSSDKVIYLTFDAGYENGNIAKILDSLKEENVRGTFFILDQLLIKNTDLVNRMLSEGHTVANHTAKHKDLSLMSSKEELSKELSSLEQLFKDKTGKDMPKYLRPPKGRFSRQSMQFAHALGYKTIFWSFAYADWDNNNQMSKDAAMKKILDNVHNGEIMLLHPTSATNASLIGELTRTLKAQGYRFATVEELS